MLKLFKAKTAFLFMMALMAVESFAQEAGSSIDTASLNGMLRNVAGAIDSIASSVSSIIAPAMIGLTIALTLLVIVVRIAKKPRSAG